MTERTIRERLAEALWNAVFPDSAKRSPWGTIPNEHQIIWKQCADRFMQHATECGLEIRERSDE